MATQQGTVDYLLEQLSGLHGVTARKMFGEWGVFLDGKTVALVCDDQLFVKPTAAGRELASDAPEAPAYRGAKPALLIDADRWEKRDWLCGLIRATADALPMPKPKKPKKQAN
jgi:DNA transformation protein and related proteins